MNVYAIYFSPTHSTEKIVKLIAQVFGNYQEIDLSKREIAAQTFAEDDLCIIGVPSYGGRVPSIALERMKAFCGGHAKAVLAAVYGNRAYDDTLRELAEFVNNKQFECVAAIAAVAEHSVMHQFASGRPDESDQKELTEFTKTILDKINSNTGGKKLNLPGNFPYREYKGIPLKPKAGRKCTNCGLCAQLCPVGAIPADAPKKTDKERCISCMRCINICPNHARKVSALLVKIASIKLNAACAEKKKNALFIFSNE